MLFILPNFSLPQCRCDPALSHCDMCYCCDRISFCGRLRWVAASGNSSWGRWAGRRGKVSEGTAKGLWSQSSSTSRLTARVRNQTVSVGIIQTLFFRGYSHSIHLMHLVLPQFLMNKKRRRLKRTSLSLKCHFSTVNCDAENINIVYCLAIKDLLSATWVPVYAEEMSSCCCTRVSRHLPFHLRMCSYNYITWRLLWHCFTHH